MVNVVVAVVVRGGAALVRFAFGTDIVIARLTRANCNGVDPVAHSDTVVADISCKCE